MKFLSRIGFFAAFVFWGGLVVAHADLHQVAEKIPGEASAHPAPVAVPESVEKAVEGKSAQETLEGPTPYIKKSPIDGFYRVMVMGDSLGVGAFQGLYQNFKADFTPKVKVIKEAKVNTGIVRADRLNWPQKIQKLTDRETFEIAVLMFGANDMQTIRLAGKAYHYQSDGWLKNYEKRIDEMIAPLKEKGVAIYWVGLPIVARKKLAQDYQYVNAIFRKKAKEHGIRFIDTWHLTADKNGDYHQYGDDLKGERSKLRARDGVHFTASGYRKLAHPVEEAIRQDLDAVGVVTKPVLSKTVPLPRVKEGADPKS